MFISDLTTSGAIPALEASVSFAAQRQRLIAHNIANIETPEFRPLDVSPREFQGALREAVERRRARTGGSFGALDLRSSEGLEAREGGGFRLRPRESGRGVLFHDRNDRDLERTMQELAENAAAHRVATDLLRSQYATLRTAITGRL